jgi:hypothetical protein
MIKKVKNKRENPMGEKPKAAPFTREDFHGLIKKAATTPVQKPAPKSK